MAARARAASESHCLAVCHTSGLHVPPRLGPAAIEATTLRYAHHDLSALGRSGRIRLCMFCLHGPASATVLGVGQPWNICRLQASEIAANCTAPAHSNVIPSLTG